MSENITINLTQPQEEITFSYTEQGEEITFSFSEAARGPQGEIGPQGPAGPALTVDQTIIDGSTNAVSGNAVFDGLALKAPIANPTFTGTVTAPHIHGSIAGNLYIHVRNDSGGVLSRGTPIYIVGNVGDTDRVKVAAADNTNSAKMPAIGLLEQDLNHNGDGNAIIVGELPSANTNAYSLNQELYVGVGAITGTKPTTGEVQSVGTVARVQTNTGVIVVNMQGRRTPDAAFATAAQGIDERVPTAAGLTSKFGTNKATIVNGDKVTILDSAASDAPKHVLWSLIVSTLTTAFNALYVGLTGNQTVAGNKTLSGQLELTGQAATNLTSAMTRGLHADEALFAIARIRNSDVATYTANAGTANLAGGDNLAAGTTANARPVAFRYANINRFGSGSNNSVIPMRIASFGSYIGITDTDPKIRCAVGMPITTSVPAANANALSGNGFGWEMYYSSSLTRMVFRLFAHNGTTYVTSSELDTGISIGSYDTFLSVIIGLNSSGTVSAWTSFANNPTTAMRPSTTATLTLAGGPTSGNFATSGVQWAVVNHSTNVASGNTQLRIQDRKLIID